MFWCYRKKMEWYHHKVSTAMHVTEVPLSQLNFTVQAIQYSMHSIYEYNSNTRLFYKQRCFSTQPQCCLTFSCIDLQMLLRCCLIHIRIITLRLFLHLLYLCSCQGLGLFMSSLQNSVSMWSIFHFHLHFHYD